MGFGDDYTEIHINGVKIRKGARNPMLRLNAVPFDFTGKTVLDLGCNCGGMLFAISHQIAHGYGLEHSQKAIDAAQKIQQENNVTNLTFQTFDLKKYRGYAFPKTDVVFMLSIAQWVPEWMAILNVLQPNVLLFEAHGDTKRRDTQISYLAERYDTVQHLIDTHEKYHRVLYLCTGPRLDIMCVHPLEYQCGELIASGGCRDVYAHKADPSLVIKVEKNRPSHKDQNKREFNNWQKLSENPEQAIWLAPCVELSPCCKYLVQRRGEPQPAKTPPTAPGWLRRDPDHSWTRHSQWVEIDGTTRLCDYARVEFPVTLEHVHGERLFNGKSRAVYVHKNDPTLVIKVEHKKPAVPGQNQAEYDLWLKLKDTPLKDIIAPCLGLYDNGRILVQQRGEKLFISPAFLQQFSAADADTPESV